MTRTCVYLWFMLLTMTASHTVNGQKRYLERMGKASFFSSAPMEDIEAHSNQVVAILDAESGELVASVLMRSFRFRKALMQEHFNENYVESHRFPKAAFQGHVVNVDAIDFSKPGTCTLIIAGQLTIHGVTRPIETKAKTVVYEGGLRTETTFNVRVKDFEIEVPRLVVNNIAEVVEVSVSFDLKPM